MFGGGASVRGFDHASRAFTRQLVLTLAKFAAASESFNFSAYPQNIFLPRVAASAIVCLAGAEVGDYGDGRPGEGGGEITSIALWLVIPLHTVLARREEKVFY